MLMRIIQVAATLVAVGGVLWLGFAMSFRTKFRPVQRVIRGVNKRVFNPLQLRTAGGHGAWASVVGHVGRTTGTAYRTPVVAVPTDDGFVIALPYGPGADWARNVVAAGSATLEHDGDVLRVARPQVVGPADADRFFPPREQRSHRRFGVDDFLLLRHSGSDAGRLPGRAERI